MPQKLYFIYTRVSKINYIDSLDSQFNILVNIAKEKNYYYTEETIIEENFSGSNNDRPEFNKMIAKLKEDIKKSPEERKYAGILFYKIDRLFRNFNDFNEIEKLMNAGYQFVSGTETIENTPTGRLLFRMLAGFAIYESEKLSNRESLTFLINALKNRFVNLGGTRPLGYKVIEEKNKYNITERIIAKNDDECKIISLIYTLKYDNPKISAPEILERMKNFNGAWDTFEKIIESRKKKKMDSKINSIKNKGVVQQIKFDAECINYIDTDEIYNYEYNIEEITIDEIDNSEINNEKRAIKMINSCLRNNQGYKYNGIINRKFKIRDELIQNFLKSISAMDDEKFLQEYKNNKAEWANSDYSIGTEIDFTFYVPELAIIDDEIYQRVHELLNKRETKDTKVDNGTRALFDGILYLATPNNESEKMNYYTTKKNTIGYRKAYNGKTIEKSELSIEKAINKSDLFKNKSNVHQYKDEIISYLETQDKGIYTKQMRAEKMKTAVYTYQNLLCNEILKDMIKNMNNTNQDDLLMIKKSIQLYSKKNKEVLERIENINENKMNLIYFFYNLLSEDINNLSREEREYSYLAMFEKIEITMNKEKIIIHLRQFMADILGVQKKYIISLM